MEYIGERHKDKWYTVHSNNYGFTGQFYILLNRSFNITKRACKTNIMTHMSICRYDICSYKNIERHKADTIVSWPNPKQWVSRYDILIS